MSNPSKQKGTKFETNTQRHLASYGIEAERVALAGANDRGDLSFELNGLKVCVECKDRARIMLPPWVEETERETRNAEADVGWLVMHRKGCGVANFGKNYVTLTFDDLMMLLGRVAMAKHGQGEG